MHEKYGVDVQENEGEKLASACERPDCPRTLDHTKEPPKCPKCGYEYLGKKDRP